MAVTGKQRAGQITGVHGKIIKLSYFTGMAFS